MTTKLEDKIVLSENTSVFNCLCKTLLGLNVNTIDVL